MRATEDKSRRGEIRELLFPHVLNRTQFLVRCLIIGLCVGLPLSLLQVKLMSMRNEAWGRVETKLESLEQKLQRLDELGDRNAALYQEERRQFDGMMAEARHTIHAAAISGGVLVIYNAFSLALYIVSFWMLYIPRLRSMRRSPKLALLMLVPLVNIVFLLILLVSPPRL